MKKKVGHKHQVRIIAGDWRGRKLPVLSSLGLRPTTDRVRETLFNWLMHDIRGSRCLDLFAGSGALGFECLSRGADYVYFVEKDKKVADLLQENLERLTGGENNRGAVYSGSSAQFIKRCSPQTFDLVFMDPPFDSSLIASSASMLEASGLLSEQALIYLEYSSQSAALALPQNWQPVKSGKAGHSAYGLWQRLPSR